MAKGGSPYEPRVYAGTACAPNEDSPQIEHCAIAGSDAESDTTTECSSELEGIYAFNNSAKWNGNKAQVPEIIMTSRTERSQLCKEEEGACYRLSGRSRGDANSDTHSVSPRDIEGVYAFNPAALAAVAGKASPSRSSPQGHANSLFPKSLGDRLRGDLQPSPNWLQATADCTDLSYERKSNAISASQNASRSVVKRPSCGGMAKDRKTQERQLFERWSAGFGEAPRRRPKSKGAVKPVTSSGNTGTKTGGKACPRTGTPVPTGRARGRRAPNEPLHDAPLCRGLDTNHLRRDCGAGMSARQSANLGVLTFTPPSRPPWGKAGG